MNGRSRWIAHNFNPADALTKLKGAHAQPMLDLLKTGMYHLVVEDLQLTQRKAEKESTGSAIRLKQSGKQVQSSYISYALPGFGGLCFVSNPNLSRMDSYETPFQQPSYKMGVPVYLSCTKDPPGDLCSPALPYVIVAVSIMEAITLMMQS